MFGIQALDVVISMIFVYLLFSLFVSIVNEILSQAFKVRGKELRFSIERMIGYKLRKEFYEKPKINKVKYRSSFFFGTPFWGIYVWIRQLLSSNIDLKADDIDKKITSQAHPSKISTDTFATTVIELIENEENRKELFKQAPFLEKPYRKANQEIEALRGDLEDWFDEIMVYTSEWYKQKLRYVLLFLGFVTAATFNVDSISIFRTLANDPETRSLVVQQAEAYIQSHNLEQGLVVEIPTGAAAGSDSAATDTLRSSHVIHDFLASQYRNCGNTTGCRDSVNAAYPTLARIDNAYTTMDVLVREDIDQLSSVLGMGWGNLPRKSGWSLVWDWVFRVIGWAATAVAISLGAPFWFDLLKKVINLKNEIAPKKREPAG